MFALQNAVYDSFTKTEFDEEWQAMLAKFSLYDNEWLGVLYDQRHRWILVTPQKMQLIQLIREVSIIELVCFHSSEFVLQKITYAIYIHKCSS